MYRTVAASFWTDPKVSQLKPDGKLLLLYLITNPHSHVSGIYIVPRVIIAHETGLTSRSVDTLCDTLSSAGICAFDTQIHAVWVKKMLLYQGRGEKNHRSAAAHVSEDMHNSFLCKQFLDFYPQVKVFVLDKTFDTLSDRVSELRTPDSRFPIPEQEQENREQRAESGGELPPLLSLGEFNHVRITETQREKLIAKLNGTFDDFVGQFDRWVQEAPNAKAGGVKRKDRDPYASILAWHDRKVKDGSLKPAGNGKPTETEIQEASARMAAARAPKVKS